MRTIKIPKSWPVQPLKAGDKVPGRTTCGACNLSWDDDKVTSMTPAPSARCPFERFHLAVPQPLAFSLRIELGNDAMRSYGDIAYALKTLATDHFDGESDTEQADVANGGNVYDQNGNKVGEWEVRS